MVARGQRQVRLNTLGSWFLTVKKLRLVRAWPHGCRGLFLVLAMKKAASNRDLMSNGWTSVESARKWRVHKFGGTSVGSSEAMLSVKAIIEEMLRDDTPLAIVVSAMGGKPKVTDLLLSTVTDAVQLRSEQYSATIELIRAKHFDAIRELALPPELATALQNVIARDLEDIKQLLKAVSIMRIENEKVLELVSGCALARPQRARNRSLCLSAFPLDARVGTARRGPRRS